MSRRTRLGLGVLAGVLTITLAPFGALSGASAAPAGTTSPGPAADPPGTRYLYAATYTAEARHDLHVDLYGYDKDDRAMSASLSGTLPSIEIDAESGDWRFRNVGKASVGVDSASAKTTQATDDARYVQTCTGSEAIVTGRPTIRPAVVEEVYLFAGLEFPTSCTDNQGGAPSVGKYFLGPVATEVRGLRGDAGDTTMTFKLRGDSELPSYGADRDESLCPGYVPAQTTSCDYTVQAVVSLELVKKIKPKKGTQGSRGPKGSKGAELSTGARTATVMLQCSADCSVTIRLTPLDGGPVLAVDRVTPKPDRPTKAVVAIPPSKRAAVRRAGGVSVELTYQAAGIKFTETRTALL